MPWLKNLANVARRTGFPVVEVSGWKTRGHGPQPFVYGIVAHHTAGRDDLHIVRDGRPGLDGPLSHFWLRHDGTIYVVAAGKCWHNAPSTSLHHDNSHSIGIEAENDGRSPWPDVQLRAYEALCAELCRAYKLPASAVKGHKEVNTGKVDPHSINMNAFRAAVARRLKGDDDVTPDEINKAVWRKDNVPVPDDYAKKQENPTWTAQTMLRDTNLKVRAQRTDTKALKAKIDQIDKTLMERMTSIEETLSAILAKLSA